MPCKDTSARVAVFLDAQDRLVNFEYSKITCSKEIGGGTGFREQCAGMTAEQILNLDFSAVLQRLSLAETEDQFLFYLEWDAVRSCLAQYLGREGEIDPERHRIASISGDENGVEIHQVVLPPQEMPKIVACTVRARLAASENGEA
jgi:hypothetical protein